MKSALIATKNVPLIWALVKPYIKAALAEGQGEYDEEEVMRELSSGVSQLWLGLDDELKLRMIATTKIEVWPKVRRLRIELLAGTDLEGFLPLLPDLEKWAKEQGCTEVVAAVRPGMRKRLVQVHNFKRAFETVIRGIP